MRSCSDKQFYVPIRFRVIILVMVIPFIFSLIIWHSIFSLISSYSWCVSIIVIVFEVRRSLKESDKKFFAYLNSFSDEELLSTLCSRNIGIKADHQTKRKIEKYMKYKTTTT